MVIDTSALVAILCNEPDARAFEAAIEEDPVRLISAATLVETSIVIESRFGDAGGRELDLLIHKASIEVIAVDAEQAEVARDAYRRYGRGRHPAGLDYGDCFSFALCSSRGERLLQGRRLQKDRDRECALGSARRLMAASR
jgi:ribonuclease VapC